MNDLDDLLLFETERPENEWDFNSLGASYGTPSRGGGRSDGQHRQVVQSEGLVQSSVLSLKRNVSCRVL